MNNQLILMSHGNFAIELLNSAEMVYGSRENITALALKEDAGIEDFKAEVNSVISNLDKESEITIFVDIIGGTPFNVAMEMCSKFENINVVTGMNLPLLLEYMSSVDCEKIIYLDRLIEATQNSIKKFSKESLDNKTSN